MGIIFLPITVRTLHAVRSGCTTDILIEHRSTEANATSDTAVGLKLTAIDQAVKRLARTG
jgi:hypothetical protein